MTDSKNLGVLPGNVARKTFHSNGLIAIAGKRAKLVVCGAPASALITARIYASASSPISGDNEPIPILSARSSMVRSAMPPPDHAPHCALTDANPRFRWAAIAESNAAFEAA